MSITNRGTTLCLDNRNTGNVMEHVLCAFVKLRTFNRIVVELDCNSYCDMDIRYNIDQMETNFTQNKLLSIYILFIISIQ